MKVDVSGQDLAAFRAISDGKYNLGSVILAGHRGLSKVNNHRIRRNNYVGSPVENQQVREALYSAICNETRVNPLDEECLSGIRAKLGLDDTGHVSEVGENAVGTKALTRRDIKQILAFTDQGKTSAGIFSAAREELKALIYQSELSAEDKAVLDANLLGTDSKLANWQRTFNSGLVSTLKFIDPATPATANAIGDQTSNLEEQIRHTCRSFVNSFVTFTRTAREQLDTVISDLEDAVNAKIEGSELKQLEQKEDEQRATDALFAQMRNGSAITARILKSRLLARLTNLTFDDVKGADVAQLARTFVEGLMPMKRDFLTRVDNNLALQAQKVTRHRNEELKAKQAVDSGREAIKATLVETDKQFTAFQKYLDLLESSFAGLAEKHPRADERLDGDSIREALKQLTATFNTALEKKTALAEKISRESAALKADNVKARQQEVAEACERLVTEARKALDAKIEELNARLNLTVIPKFGEDTSVAEAATKKKRAELSKKLEEQWNDASNDFTRHLENLLDMAKDHLAGLAPEQRQAFDGVLNGIKARFGAENRKAFVEGHGVGDAKPGDILNKAKLDVVKIIANARLAYVASTHRSLQAKFNVIQKWLAGNDENFEADFLQLTGRTLASLTGDKPPAADTLEGLKRTALYLATALKSTITRSVQTYRAEKSGERADATLSNLQRQITSLAAELVNQLSDPARVERAGKEPKLRADVTRDFDASVANVLKDLKIDEASELGRQVRADAAAIRKGFETSIVAGYVYKGQSTETLPSLAQDLLASFRSLAEARKVRGELITHVQKEIEALADKLTDSKGVPDEKQLALNKTLSTLLQTLTEDNKNVGVEATLTLDTLKAMAKKGFHAGLSVTNMTKGLTQGARSMSLAEEAIKNARSIAIDANLGAPPEAPAPNAGIDGNLVDPKEPIEDPRPQPAFDRIINANK